MDATTRAVEGGRGMSRQQWGHGYYKGVKDSQKILQEAIDGWSADELELITEYCIAEMTYSRYVIEGYDGEDASAYRVSRFYSIFHNRDRIPVSILDAIYEYILEYGPYNTQITGPAGNKDIENDVIRVYGMNGKKELSEWLRDVTERMKPVFGKIKRSFWYAQGIVMEEVKC